MENTESSNVQIIYIGDPLCSWCWGIAASLTELRKKWSDRAEFTLILGGLRPGGTDKMDGKLAQFLRHHWEQVEKTSGQAFSYDILDQTDFIYDTEPPSRAVRVVRELKPASEFDFFKAVQQTFYVDNQDTNRIETYLKLCEQFEIDPEEFQKAFESETYKQATKGDFQLSARMGVRSFPTVLLRVGEEIHVLAFGYATYEKLDTELRAQLELV